MQTTSEVRKQNPHLSHDFALTLMAHTVSPYPPVHSPCDGFACLSRAAGMAACGADCLLPLHSLTACYCVSTVHAMRLHTMNVPPSSLHTVHSRLDLPAADFTHCRRNCVVPHRTPARPAVCCVVSSCASAGNCRTDSRIWTKGCTRRQVHVSLCLLGVMLSRMCGVACGCAPCNAGSGRLGQHIQRHKRRRQPGSSPLSTHAAAGCPSRRRVP